MKTINKPEPGPPDAADDPPITLRPAAPGDAAVAAALIHAAGPALYSWLFGPTRADAEALFGALFVLGGSVFSHENGVVAVQDGRVVGLALAVSATAYHRGWALPRMLLRRGPRFLLRLVPAAFALNGSTLPPPPGAFYLGILAVAPDARSRGVGGRLLGEVERLARGAGCDSVCLHAEIGNAGARRFYARHGYVVTHERPTPRAARRGVAGFVGMRKAL